MARPGPNYTGMWEAYQKDVIALNKDMASRRAYAGSQGRRASSDVSDVDKAYYNRSLTDIQEGMSYTEIKKYHKAQGGLLFNREYTRQSITAGSHGGRPMQFDASKVKEVSDFETWASKAYGTVEGYKPPSFYGEGEVEPIDAPQSSTSRSEIHVGKEERGLGTRRLKAQEFTNTGLSWISGGMGHGSLWT